MIDFRFAVHKVKNFGTRSEQTLGISHQQEPALFQGIVEDRNDLLLQNGTEINQHIPATDQIHAGEGRIAEDILAREDAHVANRLGNLIALGNFVKKAAQTNLGHLGRYALLVETGARPLDGTFAQVGTKNLDGHFDAQLREYFDQGDGMRIGLFSGGTAGHPDPHGF